MSSMATRTALGKLIDTARAPENLSLQDIADRASRHGAKLSKQTVSRLATEQLDSINIDNIRGLALGLGISERRVAAAALATMGVDLGVDEVPLRQAILDADTVGERTKRILLSIIQDEENEQNLIATLTRSDSSFAGPEPAGLQLAADEPGEPSIGQLKREHQDKQADS